MVTQIVQNTKYKPVPLIDGKNKPSRKVYLLLGYKCNEQCLFCGLGEDKSVIWPLYKESMYDADEIKNSISDLIKNGLGKNDAIEFSGGEPTIHKDLISILKHTRRIFTGTMFLFSNGARFANMTFASDYASTGVDNTIITLHSHNEEIHDSITQVKGSWKRTVKGLANLHELGHQLSIKLIVNKKNYLFCRDWASFVKDHFPHARIMINGIALWGQAKLNQSDLLIEHSLTAPHISQAVDVFIEAGMKPGIYFMPACCFDPYYWQFFGYRHYLESVLEAQSDGQEMKSVSFANCYNMPVTCEDCLMQPRCVWAWQPYTKLYGLGELIPVIAKA